MKTSEVLNIVNKVYPKITENYNSNAKVELYSDIYTRLNCVSAMGDESIAHAEYNWSENKIYIYTTNMSNEEDIIRSLIHECVHSTQSKELFDKYYENGATYDTHPFEIQAENEETNWKKYKL
tara:strand:- start:1885 stop:2253 length:369 start_codon:yes stop_codon:yes gene_type:complete